MATTGTLETPFLEVATGAWQPPRHASTATEAPFVAEAPFLNEYAVDGQLVRAEEPALRRLLEDLFDSEFDEAVADLAAEAESYVAELGLAESATDQARAEHLLEAWAEPLRRETQAVLDTLADRFDGEDPSNLTESRVEEVFATVRPATSEYGPAFEGFVTSIVKKARSIVGGAVKAAKAGIAAVGKLVPIPLLLRKFATLAGPLLTRVLRFALDKLPVEYRDPARMLARKFLGINVSEAAPGVRDEDLDEDERDEEELEDEADELPATADIRQIQDAFDAEAAGLVFASSEQEQDLYLAEAAAASAAAVVSPLAALDEARARFVDGVARLEEGEDPTPLVENFLPAILPALRLGLKVAGRPRVVRFLAQYLGRLIAPYVGPTVTPGLSRAIADAGLRAMTLETAETEAVGSPIAAEAFAALVEDTAAKVAQLDEAELGLENLVEEVAYSAFHESAAANFPAAVLMPAAEHEEVGRADGTWVSMPRRGPWRYRKYSRVFNVVIHPSAARAIVTFGGRPLSAFLRDAGGRTGPVRARVHLYQAVPGTTVGRIARAERDVAGLGAADPRTRGRLHPLTPMAAAALLGEPGLGREVSEDYADGTGPLAIGQRLYYLEVPNAAVVPTANPQAVAGGTASSSAATDAVGAASAASGDGGAAGDATSAQTPSVQQPAGRAAVTAPRSSQATATIDTSSGTVTVTIYASEADAQVIAARLRRREPVGATLAALRRIYGPALGKAIASARPQRIRMRSEAEDEMDTEDYLPGRGYARRGRQPGFARRPRVRRRLMTARRRGYGPARSRPRQVRRRLLVSWVGRALAAELERARDGLLRAADEPADGVTIVLRLRPPSLRALLAAGTVTADAGPGEVQVEITPGTPRD